jgi:DNA-binding NarL/FixJ family response regulator
VNPAREPEQPPSEVIRVLLVDDHKLVRQGLRAFLSGEDDIEVVAEAANGREALDRLMGLRSEDLLPDVVLMDLKMEPIDGVQATREIRSRFADVQVVVITSFLEEERAQTALDAGASGYVLKDAEVDEIVGAVRAACRGELHVDAKIAKRLMRSLRAPMGRERAADLTERELEILRLLAAGHANKEIAAQLVISERTARTHVSNILRKLGLTSRTQAALWAVREGLVGGTPSS